MRGRDYTASDACRSPDERLHIVPIAVLRKVFFFFPIELVLLREAITKYVLFLQFTFEQLL